VGTSIDGFELAHADAFASFSPRAFERASRAVHDVGRLLGVTIDGVERLPEGRALVVANHTFGFDVAFAIAEVERRTGRVLWSLGEHAWWRFPFLRSLVVKLGVVDGTQANADRLLADDQLLLVLPGGLRESVKPHELRYRLLWGKRYGFVRTALRHRAPIVPLAMVGADDLFTLVGNPFARGRRLGFPLPRPSFGVPLLHPVRLKGIFGEPIAFDLPPSAADDPALVRRCRREVEGALHELLDQELARRAGFPLDGRT
jgi:1-acyl-sn-glycerol-3-phosphate acyltransferase